MRKFQQGITLVELLVVVVIISILMTVAVPSYRQYAMRANRAEAKWNLLRIAAAQEKFYLQNNTYADDDDFSDAPPNGLGIDATTESGLYTLSITAADATGFQAQALAEGGQTDDTDCDVFGIDDTGVRYGGPGPLGTGNDPDCW
ncbi:MAG: pilus assembly protein PilE [Chromatiales bacterium]|jgi:type IV pilus assembly protein PilE|nr:pilus assembly protein PilE [Chromatiales bacterium]MDP6150363.1 type IV pilin protein [Gammaproteobacteria bacterium]MDP7093260.1 type IV pilin protein [Gammaproteobacteria bacterium]MDP7270820.1 type IV pilin protein [Gammaproteobacteria bacterium]HJP04869.1 type IV pilin protein [Gammaproteobacteria bacterium]